jgi:hypothetical protein
LRNISIRGHIFAEIGHFSLRLSIIYFTQNNEYIQSVARCLQMMLRIDEYRFAFVSVDGISTLLSVLSGRVNFQVQYQLVFCLWVLTFNPLLAEKMNKFNVIPILADILSDSVKEKVTRIILAVFRNLIEKPEDAQVAKEHCIAMVQCKVSTNRVIEKSLNVRLSGFEAVEHLGAAQIRRRRRGRRHRVSDRQTAKFGAGFELVRRVRDRGQIRSSGVVAGPQEQVLARKCPTAQREELRITENSYPLARAK